MGTNIFLFIIYFPSCPFTRGFTVQEVRVTGLSYALLFFVTDIIRATAMLFTALMILPIVKDLPIKFRSRIALVQHTGLVLLLREEI